MSVNIAIPPSLEQQLRNDAARQGISFEQYVAQVFMTGIAGSVSHDEKDLSEDELLQRVQLNVQPGELEEYYRLVESRKSGNLTKQEYEDLLALTNRIEMAHAERMKYVVALANLRGISLEKAMHDLNIQKQNT